MKPIVSGLMLATPLALALAAGPASATDMYANFSSCNTKNCASTFYNSSYNIYGTQNGLRAPTYVVKVWANTGECLRLDVIAEAHDLEMEVVAPNPSVFYRNDQRAASEFGACGVNCPLVKIDNAQRGYYTVVLHEWTGALVQGNFTMAYGRYNGGNTANCSSPTPPTSLADERAVKTEKPFVLPEEQ